ncbi:trafficking kinesin-binding protein 1-like isoform X3 [Mizuhopecten yessoensis]|uniref:trafficking kinesin-binding protein 1-like isoform X3 n=1 Tax=Mizuhopecten yessoensis TaxID=6573 RepID=UPI000B45D4A9|nr:trafficking kinesin-binding protein 1-like isoform X3 [Mizuhopecten yessoensis]
MAYLFIDQQPDIVSNLVHFEVDSQIQQTPDIVYSTPTRHRHKLKNSERNQIKYERNLDVTLTLDPVTIPPHRVASDVPCVDVVECFPHSDKLDPSNETHFQSLLCDHVPTSNQENGDELRGKETKEIGVLTDVCNSADLPEVEIFSLIEEQIPKYRLRADTITNFCGYENEDWIQTPIIPLDQDIELTTEQIAETLKYFILCAERVTQMTRAYNDIEAVNRLLEEKERDLELAARIGQTLLQKNQDLTDKNESLEEQVSQATEKLNQFRHEILRKDELLQALTHSESDSTPTEDSPNGNTEGLYALGASSLQKKVKSLEQENVKLRIETVQLSAETSDFEEKEQKLVSDCLEQLGEVKDQIAVYSQELAQKTEETYLQKEEITNLLAQLVDLQRKCKVLTAENLELQKHLEASQSAQKHLTKELAEYKDKHDEVLELLEENQEELRRLRRQHKPNVAKHSYLSTSLLSIPNDSIASELESSLKSEIDYPVGYSPAERKVHNWRIFETAKAAKKASNKHNGISNSNSFGTEKTSGISGMSCMSGLSTLSLNDSLDSGAHSPRMSGAHSPRMSGAASSVGRPSTASAGMSNRSSMYFSECESVQSDGYTADLDSLYGDVKKHSLGRPGIPGSNDLETALRKLSIRRANELNEEDFFEDEEKRKRQRHRSDTSRSDAQESTDTTGMCQTPDSTLSTGSFRSGFSQLSYPGSNNPHYRLPEKLKIIKPLEGSVTLRHWQQLATPHLGGIFESRPGVQIKGERKLDMDEEVYNLSDFEEDDDYEDNTECYKRFQESSTINTYTNSTVKHPTQLVGEDGSELDSDIDCVESTSTKLSTPRLSSMVQSSGTTTYSMSLGLAAILNERDFLSPTDNKPQTSGSKQSRSGCLVSESHFDLEKSKAQALTVTSSSGASVSLTTSSPTKMSAEKPNSLSGVDYQEANILSRIKNTGFSLYGYLGKLGQRSDSVVSLPTHLHDNTKVSQEGAIPKVSVCSVPTQSSSVDNLVTIASATEGGSEASKSTSTSAIFGSGASGGGVLGALTSIRKSGIF